VATKRCVFGGAELSRERYSPAEDFEDRSAAAFSVELRCEKARCEKARPLIRLHGFHGSGTCDNSTFRERHDDRRYCGALQYLLRRDRLRVQAVVPQSRNSQQTGTERLGRGELLGQSYVARHAGERRGASTTKEAARADQARTASAGNGRAEDSGRETRTTEAHTQFDLDRRGVSIVSASYLSALRSWTLRPRRLEMGQGAHLPIAHPLPNAATEALS
jgi:hypothetical protein